MIGLSSSITRSDHERDVSAVAALVKLLADSGFQPNRIEAALVKPATPANAGRIADCYAEAVPGRPARRSRAA